MASLLQVNLNLARSLGQEAILLSPWALPAALGGAWMIAPIVLPALMSSPSSTEAQYKFSKDGVGEVPTLN